MHELITDRLNYVLEHTKAVTTYCVDIRTAEDFTVSEEGRKSFDAVSSRLQAIGENFKKIEKLASGFLKQHITADFEQIIKFRDFISHHYEKLDNDIVFDICKNDIHNIHAAVKNYLLQNPPE